MKQEHTQEDDSYAAEFINLFGKDTATHTSSNSNNIINNNYNNNNGMVSAHPLDQFVATASSSSSLPVVAARSNTQLYDHAVTPEILLEQLAYVDNFIPSLDNEFSNVDWNVNTTHNNINNNGTNSFSSINANPFDLDEQLAIELSAFADDSFIFPDEDKPNNSNNCDNDDNDDDVLHEDALPNNNRQRNPHFLTQRRNTFLTSQYDQSKSRFSSRNKTNHHNGETNNFDNSEHENHNFQPSFMTSPPQFPVSAANAASTDHGGFTNVDISSHGDSAAANSNSNGNNNNNNNNVNTLSHLLRRTTHTPNRSSPLSNVASAHNISQQRQPDTKTSIDSNNDSNGSNKSPNITIPDYSIIPTSVLVTLLPRVNVPKGAYNSLAAAGFDNDQIDAIAAIMAYHHQKKSRENNNNTSNGTTSVSQEAPILKNINELLNVLIPSSSTDTAVPFSSSTSSSSFNEHDVVAEASFLSSILELGVNHSKSNNIHNERQSPRNDNNSLLKENSNNNNNKNNSNGATSNSNTNLNNEIAKIRSEPTLNVAPATHKEKVLKRSHSGDSKDKKLPIECKYSEDDEDDEDDDADLPSHKRKQFIKKELKDDDDDLLIQSKKSHQRKKVKEKELESSIHELTEIAASLQKRIHTLETENKLLKNLVLSSGETEGIKKAESLKKQILEKVQKE
ncbi:met4p [Saccharomyces arboricola H-6]|uniref:Met4p n=1 Tax=Saccharomyces arboricola (strain H-6 / AS 2.3317 / CBS 10644) TaxID=1160507 RepID=J8LIY9_SACAR|nr:met4p [Saccharomyces arboricola H-6]